MNRMTWGEKMMAAGPIAFAVSFYVALATGCLSLAVWFLRLGGIVQ